MAIGIDRAAQAEVDPSRAAKLLGVCRVTVYRWADRALHGEPSPLRQVRRLPNGRIRIARADLVRVERDCYRVGNADKW